MKKSTNYYPTPANLRRSYLRKRPYHSHLKVRYPRHSNAHKQGMCAKWTLTLQTLDMAIAKCISREPSTKRKALNTLDETDSEEDCAENRGIAGCKDKNT